MAERRVTLAELYPNEAGFMSSWLVSPQAKLARLQQMCRAESPKPKHKRPYKGSKAAKRASRRKHG